MYLLQRLELLPQIGVLGRPLVDLADPEIATFRQQDPSGALGQVFIGRLDLDRTGKFERLEAGDDSYQFQSIFGVGWDLTGQAFALVAVILDVAAPPPRPQLKTRP